MRNEAIEALGAGHGLRVEFIWNGDRFGHVIFLLSADGSSQALLESIEGAASDDWPASPPLQNLSVESLPDGRRVALLVGMAGGSHWSASVEPLPGDAGVIFDFACRHSNQPSWLGNRYRQLASGVEHLAIKGDQMRVVNREQQVEIEKRAEFAKGTSRWKYSVRRANAEGSMRSAED